jgi:hypothetical protein
MVNFKSLFLLVLSFGNLPKASNKWSFVGHVKGNKVVQQALVPKHKRGLMELFMEMYIKGQS